MFRLAGMASTLEERVLYANNNKLSYVELLELLCDDEKNNRYDNSYQRRKKAAKLPNIKQLEDFDFSFQKLTTLIFLFLIYLVHFSLVLTL